MLKRTVSIAFLLASTALLGAQTPDKVPLPPADAARTVRLHLDRLDLQPGDYFVNVGLYERSWAYAYDYHWRAYPLGITSEHSGSGLLNPPRRWESDSAELPARRAGTVPLS